MAAVGQRLNRPAALVVLGWLAGAALLRLMLAAGLPSVRRLWLELTVLAWLLPLAVYDARRCEVPHMVCVAVPGVAALAYSFVTWPWQLGTVAFLTLAASERQVIRSTTARRWLTATAIALASILALASGEAAPGAIAALGFWLAFELGWWAGADALVAITLALLWPDIRLLVALALAHLVAAAIRLAARHGTFLGKAPGLPVICVAVGLLGLWRLVL